MDRKYLLKSAIKVARFSRILAKAIDLFIVLVLSLFLYPIGILFSIVYLIFADSIQNGQSVGKKFIGFRVISLIDGTPCSLKQSFIRNLPFIIPLAFAIIPVAGWFMAIIIGLPFVGVELYLLYKLDSGHRLGDVMADTTVMANDDTMLAIKKRKTNWFEDQGTQA